MPPQAHTDAAPIIRACAKSCGRRAALTPRPLSLNGRGGAERILMKNLPSPREGEGQGVRGPELTLLMPCTYHTIP